MTLHRPTIYLTNLLSFATLIAVLAFVALAPAAEAAAPTCVTATPATRTLADSSTDAEGDAAELTGARISLDADCTISFGVGVSGRPQLHDIDAIVVYLNTDGNPATGAVSFGGGDRAVGLVADSSARGYAAMLGTWDDAHQAIDFDNPAELDLPAIGYGFVTDVHQLGLTSGTTLDVEIAAVAEHQDDTFVDFVPDESGNGLKLPLAFGAAAPVTTSPGGTTPAGTDAPVAQATCTVPKLRGTTPAGARRLLKKAGCRVGRTRYRRAKGSRPNRVLLTLPGAGRKISAKQAVSIVVSR